MTEDRETKGTGKAASANVLELRCANQPEFQAVSFKSLKGRELIVTLKGVPPQFGDTVELRNPAPDGRGDLVKAEVVGLERDPGETGAVRVVMTLSVDAADAIARLFSSSVGEPRSRHKLADSPIFKGFDEDPPTGRRKRKSRPSKKGANDSSAGSEPPPAVPPQGGQDSGELSWGWVARDEDALKKGDVRATPVGEIDIDALSKALATAQGERGSDLYSRLSDSWSPAPESVPAPSESGGEVPALDDVEVDIEIEAASPPPDDRTASGARTKEREAAVGDSSPMRESGTTPAMVDRSLVPILSDEALPEGPHAKTGRAADEGSHRRDSRPPDAGRYHSVHSHDASEIQEEVFKKKPPPRTEAVRGESSKPPHRREGSASGYLYTSEKPAAGHRRSRGGGTDDSEVARPSKRPSTAPPRPSMPRSRQGDREPRSSGEPRGSSKEPRKERGTRERRSRGAARALGSGEAPSVGIDIGSTYSKIAALADGQVALIEDRAASSATRAAVPSLVSLGDDGEWVVGELSRELLWTDPSRVVSSAKRMLGLTYSDPQSSAVLTPLAVPALPGPDDAILFAVGELKVGVVDVVSHIVKHLVDTASEWAAREVTRAVITVPVDFETAARRELEQAARKAGVDVMAMIPEPVSAAMGCGFTGVKDSVVAVYDFGGGTCDVSIVRVANDGFTILGSAADKWLGGADLDEVLVQHVVEEFQAESGISLEGKQDVHERLLAACEESKRWLSTLETVDVIVPRVAEGPDEPVTLRITLARGQFEELIDGVVGASLRVCEDALQAAGTKTDDIDALLVTGGTTRVPAVRRAVQEFFGRKALFAVHPEHAVVIGAAINAAMISGARVPEGFVESLRGRGRVSHQIGLALADGTTEPVIESSQMPPVAAHRLFCTSQDGQTACRIELVEGDSTDTSENQRLGGFIIDGLPSRKAGETKLDIYFELSSTGTLFVTAQDRATGHRAQGIFDIPVD